MHEWQSLSHVRWECKYHIVIIPKYRKRMLYGKLKKHVGEVIKEVGQEMGRSKVFKFPAVLSLGVIIQLLSLSDLVATLKESKPKPAVLELTDA